MLKTKAPRYNTGTAVNKAPAASTHLWEDFCKQVGSYARRINVVYKDVPKDERFESRQGKQDAAIAAWYNKSSNSEIFQ